MKLSTFFALCQPRNFPFGIKLQNLGHQSKRVRTILSLVTLTLLVAACSLPAFPGPGATPTTTATVAAPSTVDEDSTGSTPTATGQEAASMTGTITATAAMTAATIATSTTSGTTARVLLPTPQSATAETTDAVSAGETTSAPVVPPADEAAARLQAPAGFVVRIFASDLSGPRLMTVGPDGILYVAERGANRVIRLPDANHDGLADEVQVVATGLMGAHSVEWFDGWLYVAANSRVVRLRDENNDGEFETPEVVTDNIPSGGVHSTRTLHFSPDGKLYVAAGSSSNNNPESDPRRAAIMRFNPDGSIPEDNPYANDTNPQRRPVWAEGLRNSVDFLFLPDGRLWADHNGVDGLGDDVPPEEIVINVEKGKHYGWPYCYTPTLGVTPPGTNEVRDERVPLDPNILANCSAATPALFTDLAHQAPLGMTQYNADAFPAAYQGNLFVAYHGSWNSSVPRDCKVQMVVVRDGEPVSSEPFLTGFRDNDQQTCNQAWGRPAGVTVGAAGELYVSDDENGNIYRIVYVGE
ncbi:MAG: PQQ-dependent sugar dehydrogenase [Caldilineaceae bacterium]